MIVARSLPLAALLLVASLPAQDKHVLRYQFTPGAVVHHKSVSDVNMEMDMGGQKMNITMSREVFMKLTIREVKDGVAATTVELTRAKMLAATPMGKFTFDSDEDEKAPGMLAGMEDIVGAKIEGKLDAMGKWVELKLPESIADGPHAQDLEQSMKSGVMTLPQDGVAVGGTWESEIEMGGGQGPASKVHLINKLLAVSDKTFEVEQTVKVDEGKEEGGADTDLGAPEMKVKKGKGTGVVNLATGFPKKMSLEMEIEMGGPGGQGSMLMKATQKMDEYTPAPKKEAKDGDK